MKLPSVFLFLFLSANVIAQDFPVDKSPLDIAYYPVNYPVLKIQDKITEPLVARIIFSRPQVNGRVVFGDLIEYGKIWRLGANEATEIEFFQNVTINNNRIKKGRYTMYAIPYEDKWTVILNKDTDSWGSFKYDPKKDVVRTDLPVEITATPSEFFSAGFEKSANGPVLKIMWENASVTLPFSL